MLPSKQYGGASLADVLPSCLNSLGIGSHNAVIPLPSVTSAVIVIVDGLGMTNITDSRAHARHLWSLAHDQEHINTVFPSTTASALASFVTGTTAGQHGITGYQVRDPQTNTLLNQLHDMANATQPWLRKDPLFDFEHSFHIIGHPRFYASTLTRTLYRGAHYESEVNIYDRVSQALEISEKPHTLSVIYISELDELAHKKGVESREWSELLETVDGELYRLIQNINSGVGIIITADHGVIDVPHENHVLLGDHGEFDNADFVGGEPRCLQLYLSSNVTSESEATRLRSLSPQHVEIYTRSEVIGSGLYGNVSEEVIDRLGDIFIFADDGYAIYDSRDLTLKGRQMVGQHGGYTSDEMNIPFIRAGAYLP